MKTLKEALESKFPKYGKIVDDYATANSLEKAGWKDLTKVGLSNFVDYLEENMAQSSVKTYCAMLKSVMNLYSDEVNLPSDYAKILSVKGCVSQNTWLNDEEINLLIKYEPQGTIERLVRNQFVIGCAVGARHSDIVKFTKENIIGNSFVYVSQKTHIKSEVPLSPIVVKFLDDIEYVDRTVCVDTYNDTIRHICKLCGINQRIKLFRRGIDMEGEKWQFISAHSSRRSFASNLYLRGADLLTISKLMGHSDVSMTCHYVVAPPRLNDKIIAYFSQFK
jgi:integrase